MENECKCEKCQEYRKTVAAFERTAKASSEQRFRVPVDTILVYAEAQRKLNEHATTSPLAEAAKAIREGRLRPPNEEEMKVAWGKADLAGKQKAEIPISRGFPEIPAGPDLSNQAVLLRYTTESLQSGRIVPGEGELADKQKAGKLRFDLIPPGPLRNLVEVYGFGAGKYADRNWEKGLPWLDAYASLVRHVQAWREGQDLDPESGLPHLAHAAWWCFALLEYSRTHPELDDRPK